MPEIIRNQYLSVEIQENFAIVWMDQEGEKINKVAPEMIGSFVEVIEAVESRTDVEAAILISRKKDFIAGADIDRFLTYKPGEAGEMARKGHEILNRVAKSKKPYIAAIHGACMGAGLEIAMACHARVVTESSSTLLAQPEVKLGILPGGGGTQRLPQLVGLEEALKMILSGKNVYATQAVEMGLATLLVQEKDLLRMAKLEATRLAKNAGASSKPNRPFFSKMMESFSPTRKFIFKKAKERVLRETKGNYPAPLKILEAIAEGYEHGFEKGLELEAKHFDTLVQSPEAKQLVHLFFAMTELKKNPWSEFAIPIDFIGVIGDKNSARGIIPDLIMKEFRIKMKGDYHSRMDKIKEAISKKINKRVEAKTIDESQGKSLYQNFIPGLDYGMLENVDMVIDLEAGNVEVKQKTLQDVEAMTERNSVFAISSSYLTMAEITSHAAHPEKVVGIRYITPDARAPFVEIIPTAQTEKTVTATVIDLAIKQGKAWILVKDNPGFYVGRLQAVFLNEALGLLYHGGDVSTIDDTLEKAGFTKGPFKMIDEMGLIEAEKIINTLNSNPNPGQKPRTVYSLHAMIAAGFEGQENRKGFYRYDEETGKREKGDENQDIYQFWRDEVRKEVPTEEMHGRLFYEVINEAAYCLQNGVIQSARDGDLGAIFGVGFPPFLGGPFRYVDGAGLPAIIAKLKACEGRWGKAFKPPAILGDFAAKGQRFYD